MANTLLTPTVILREAGQLFHQKAKFIRSIDRQYDSRYSQSGAKVGDTIALRDPVQFTTTTGVTMNLQNVTETSQNLTIGTRKHIAFSFSAAELSLKIDDFSARYLQKGIAQLAAQCESDVLTQAVKATNNIVDADTVAFQFTHAAQAKQKMDENLAPEGNRTMLLTPTHATKYLVDTKGLFVPGAKLSTQYGSGTVQDALGFNVDTSTFLGGLTTGTAAKTTGYSIDSSGTVTGTTITLKSGSTTFKVGDKFTIATLNAVHPETKVDLGYLKQFTVTADSGINATSLKIFPGITPTGPYQNVSTAITTDQALVKLGAGASEVLQQSLAYPQDAFCFATADLEDPSKYGQWGATENMDSLSMRIWRSADIVNDVFPCRIDIFYGFLARYPQLACTIHADG